MSSVLGSIFGFGDSLKRRLRDAVSNPSDYAEMTADQNQREWARNPDERSMGFFNPVPLGTMGNFTLRKELSDALPNLSRRDFMKKSAGIAGGTAAAAIPGAKLLQKFAPEEKQIAKEIVPEAKPAGWDAVQGGSYRYHSLKDYLDDVQRQADDLAHESGSARAAETEGYNSMDYDRLSERFAEEDVAKHFKRRLLDDEAKYKDAKKMFDEGIMYKPDGTVYSRSRPNLTDDTIHDKVRYLESFSPQAKQEMKALKDKLDFAKEVSGDTGTWADTYINNPSILEGGFF